MLSWIRSNQIMLVRFGVFSNLLAIIRASMTKLLRKTAPFKWTVSFEKLKTVLTQAPVLFQPESWKDYVVYSDASHSGLGCVLMQDGKVMTYASR
ncbi:Retrovirus-related Pol polyprotein from transposon 17.6 [Gossypium australe]|uniref:Retrovirus-related Pol polyprotein from transposon 17.6 n=1 Tax=Gossypium australe TaxID=47621 RepID=A0A5B6VX74_9ROSI|nr:Retrovirus-related Pol polyprotein from transposon 17.6 [Gossypium australe]